MNTKLTAAASLCGMLAILPTSAPAQQWSHSGPLPRFLHTAVWDAVTNKMIVFGGDTGTLSGSGVNQNDVWWLNNPGAVGMYWSRPQITGIKPAPRSGPGTVYDPISNRMIVFGGALGQASPCANDVWALENVNGVGGTPQWTQLSPSGGPPPIRTRFAAVYDQTANTMIIYGGNNCFSEEYSDVWTLTKANGVNGTPVWTQLSPTGTGPAARENTSAVYDPVNNRMILYGGNVNDPNVWVLTNANGTGGTPAWIQLPISGTLPTARCCNSIVYDAADNVAVIFGGQNETGSGALLNDTWILSNANGLGTPAWTQLNPTLTYGPEPRDFHTAVYNPTTNEMVIFGGFSGFLDSFGHTVYFEDVWVLANANGT